MSGLSEQRIVEITEMAKLMISQDNRHTQFPLFYVYEVEERWVDDEADYDYWIWVDQDGDYSEVARSTDDIPEDGIENLDDNYERRYIKDVGVPATDVGPFFTEMEAKRHIELNSYHYNKPYTYVCSAWRNPEMQMILKVIFEIAGEDIPSCYR